MRHLRGTGARLRPGTTGAARFRALPSGPIRNPRRPLSVLALILMLLLPVKASHAGEDYSIANLEWNGLSQFAARARANGVKIVRHRSLDLSRLPRKAILLFCHPQDALPENLEPFIRRGGRVLIADDFGSAEGWLAKRGYRKYRGKLTTPLHYGGDAQMPVIATPERHMLLWGVDELVANRPAAYGSSRVSPLAHFGQGEKGLLFYERLGQGELILLSDPSILINAMRALGDNDHLADNLIRFMARGLEKPVIRLFRGSFSLRGPAAGPLASGPGAESGLKGALNQMGRMAVDGIYGTDAAIREISDYIPDPSILSFLAFLLAIVVFGIFYSLWGGGAPADLPKFQAPMSRFKREAEALAGRRLTVEVIEAAAIYRQEFEDRLFGSIGEEWRPPPRLQERWLSRLRRQRGTARQLAQKTGLTPGKARKLLKHMEGLPRERAARQPIEENGELYEAPVEIPLGLTPRKLRRLYSRAAPVYNQLSD